MENKNLILDEKSILMEQTEIIQIDPRVLNFLDELMKKN